MAILWSYQAEAIINSSVKLSQDSKIYVADGSGLLYALDTNGNELWRFQTAGYNDLGNSTFATPAIAEDGTVYVAGLYDPNLYALDANDGGIKWVCNFQHSRETITGFVCGELPQWPWYDCWDEDFTFTKFGWPFASPVVAEDGTIYQGLLYDPNLYAVSPDDGSIVWSLDLAEKTRDWLQTNHPNEPVGQISNSCWSQPALGPDGTIYVSFDDPFLRALDPNGSIKWISRLGTVGGFTMTVGANGLIYAAGDDGQMYVVNPAGEEISRFETDQWLSFPVITAGGAIIVSDSNDTVWAIVGGDCMNQAAGLHRPADINADGSVNLLDLAKMNKGPQNNTGKGFYPAGDINRDSRVDYLDLALLASRWLGRQ